MALPYWLCVYDSEVMSIFYQQSVVKTSQVTETGLSDGNVFECQKPPILFTSYVVKEAYLF